MYRLVFLPCCVVAESSTMRIVVGVVETTALSLSW
jgi:hypothetical protein